MGYLLFCGYYFFRPFRAPPAVLCESGYLLEQFLRAKGELRKRKDRCGGGTTHISSYVVICLHMSPFGPIWHVAPKKIFYFFVLLRSISPS